MKQIFIIVLFLSVLQTISAQDFKQEFGKITQADIDMVEVEFDKDAEAAIIFDLGKSFFERNPDGFDLIFERHMKIKILKEAGIENAEIEIPFYREGDIWEKVYDLKATTYNFENSKLETTDLKPENTYDEISNEYWMTKKFAMPAVKVGSIIEISYKISSQYVFNLRDWNFQHIIPTLYSEYVVRMIPFYEYTFILQGNSKFDIHSSAVDYSKTFSFRTVEYRDMVHHLGMLNIPAFKDEEFITSVSDYIIKMDFQLSQVNSTNGETRKIQTTWPTLIKDLNDHEDFGVYINKSKRAAKKQLNLERLLELPEGERFNEVIDYVKSNYSWNHRYGKYSQKTLRKFVLEKHGNDANINLFLTGLLKAVGLEAYPVVLSTRDHGKIKYKYPFSSFLNYVIVSVKVNGKTILADATEEFASNQMIPPRCLNDKGLMVKKKCEEWVKLVYKYPARQNMNMSLDFGEDMSTLNADIEISAMEYDALRMRKKFAGDKEKLIELIEDDGGYKVLEEPVIENLDNPEKPFHTSYKVSLNNYMVNGKIYVSPFLNEPISTNPMKQQKRKYPIDMQYPKARKYFSQIKIPEGYKLDYLPETKSFSNDLFEYQYNVYTNDGNVIISFGYFFKKGVYPAKDYLRLKLWFDDIINLSNEKIVFVKEEDI